MTPQEQRDSHLAELARQAGIEGTRPNVLGAAGAQPFFEPLASMSNTQLQRAMRRNPLPMPGVEAGSPLEKLVKPAWDIVSRLWPTMAAKVPRIRFMTETESGKLSHASAGIHIGSGELALPQGGPELRPEVLWHELVHLEQRERGVLQSGPMRDASGALTEHGQLMESEAHQRGNMQAEDLIARTFDPKINAPDFSLHRGTEPQGTPRKGGQQTGENTSIPVGESAQSSQSGSVPVAQSAQGNYDKRDVEVGKHIAGMNQERFRRDKHNADLKINFAKAGGNLIGGMLGRAFRKHSGINIPDALRSPLLQAIGGVPMFGEGMDASVSGGSGGGGDSSGDMNAKLDKIIEMLSQMGRGGGGSVTGPQPDTAFASGDVPQQSMVRQAGKMALESAATAVTGGAASSSDSMWEMAAKAMMRALIVAAV